MRFKIPDSSITSQDRGLYALAAPKEVHDLKIPLHDARTDTNIVKDPVGLDTQGFAYVDHHSALDDSDRWFIGQDFEEIYMPEVRDLVCKVTGAKKAIIINCAFRRRLADEQADQKFYYKKGCTFDQELATFPKNVAMG